MSSDEKRQEDAPRLQPLIIWAFGYRIFGLGPFALLPDVFTLAALAVLIYHFFKN